VKNGRYCSNGKPDRREIQVDRSLFFHGFAHTALFYFASSGPEAESNHNAWQTLTVTKKATSSVN